MVGLKARDGRDAFHGLSLEDIARCKFQTCIAASAYQLDGHDAVPAEREEAFMDTHSIKRENRGEEITKCLFGLSAWFAEIFDRPFDSFFGSWQGSRIHLSVRGEGKRIQDNKR